MLAIALDKCSGATIRRLSSTFLGTAGLRKAYVSIAAEIGDREANGIDPRTLKSLEKKLKNSFVNSLGPQPTIDGIELQFAQRFSSIGIGPMRYGMIFL